jgi:hypothetical protein
MPAPDRTSQLSALFDARAVVTFAEIQAALGSPSRATVFRTLQRVTYRRSYNHNGRYYTRHDPRQYDRFGLRALDGIYFSRDRSLKATVVRLVQEADSGRTHRELRDLLRVRVQFALVEGVSKRLIDRCRMQGLFVYVHHDEVVRAAQLACRQQRLDSGQPSSVEPLLNEVSDAVIIEVLLTLIRHPGAGPGDVVRYLRGHAPPIRRGHVDAVFARYDLGEKGGSSTS